MPLDILETLWIHVIETETCFPCRNYEFCVCLSLIEPSGRHMPSKWYFSYYTKLKWPQVFYYFWNLRNGTSIWQQLAKQRKQKNPTDQAKAPPETKAETNTPRNKQPSPQTLISLSRC